MPALASSNGGVDVWSAAKQGSIEDMTRFIKTGQINKTRWSGVTPLHRAAQHGQLEMVRLLIQHGAALDARSTWGWYTPLHQACKAGQEEVAKELIQSGANWLIRDKHHATPMRWAVKYGHANMGHRLDEVYQKAKPSSD